MPIPVLFSAVLFAATPSAATDGAVLRTAAELDAFSNGTQRRFTPFCVTGTVQAIEATDCRQMVVSDPSGRVEIRNDSRHRPVPGERVEMTGYAHQSSRLEIEIVVKDMKHIGTDAVTAPLELRLRDISEREHHLQAIVTEGTVIDTFRDEIDALNQFLILKDADVILPVAVPVDPGSVPDFERLRDTRLRITGRFRRTVNGGRKFSGPFIAIDGQADISVLVPAPSDPFSAPPLEKTLYRSPREIANLGKRSVFGEVLAVWGENQLMLRSPDNRIVNVVLAHGQSMPQAGVTVTVAGYPETDLFRINLSRAVVRVEPQSPVPQRESEITDLKTVFEANRRPNTIDYLCYGRLMRLRGTVQSVPSPESSERRLLLACDPFKLPVDLGTHPKVADDLALGTEVEVVGRCLLEIDSWRPDDIFPRIRNLALVIRTPDDIRIVARPPWWTPSRLLVVIGVLLLALVGAYVWNRILKRMGELKIGERTRLAVELHDSLSQTLAGVACQIAASDNAIDEENTVAKDRIKTAERMLKSCRTELRHCLFDLRSDTLEEKDFSAAIRKTLDQLEGDADIAVRFDVPRSLLDDAIAHAIIAIVRELTGNALRHGNATKIKVAGSVEDGHVLFSVTDNGSGFDPARCAGSREGHFGLEGIRDRLKKLGGTFEIKSTQDKGAKAVLALPIREKQHPRRLSSDERIAK